MKNCLLFILLAFPVLAGAHTLTDTVGNNSTQPATSLSVGKTKFHHSFSFQLEAGTQGLGADLRYALLSRFSLRTGLSFIPVSKDNVLTLPGFQSTNSASVNFYNVHLLADFVPFKKARGFRLVGGAAYLYRADGGLTVVPTGTYTYGSTVVTGADIGNLNLDVSWKGIAPYAGIGLFKSFPSHIFNFNLDLGTYYLSQPSTHIVGTGLLTDNSSLEPQFNQNLRGYRWLPVLQLNFNFKLK
jgi:hypothetical protein